MEQLSIVYVTTPSIDIAKSLGKSLLEKRIAACINILPAMTSMYWWEEKIETSEEVVLLVKTASTKVNAAIEMIETLHPYSVPCAMALPITQVSEGYKKWLLSNMDR